MCRVATHDRDQPSLRDECDDGRCLVVRSKPWTKVHGYVRLIATRWTSAPLLIRHTKRNNAAKARLLKKKVMMPMANDGVGEHGNGTAAAIAGFSSDWR